MSQVSTSCHSLCSARIRVRTQAGLDQLRRELTHAVAHDLEDGGGENSVSVYESSWVALVRNPEQPSRLAYPDTFAWILERQRPDGGWGPSGPYSLLPTMTALLAVLSHPHGAPAYQRVIATGSSYLQATLAQHAQAGISTPFIELLAPMVAEKLHALGLALPYADLESLRSRGIERRARLPAQALYHTHSTLIHALEAFGPNVDYQRLRALRAIEGGYGASPAATASVLLHAPDWDQSAADWLASLTRQVQGRPTGGMPAAHPLDIFEVAWIIHFLMQGGYALTLGDRAIAAMAAWLRASMTPAGVSMARSRALPEDGDDTAMALAALNDLGIPTSLDPLCAFEANGHYVSYHGESSSSLSANAHALEALLSVTPAHGQAGAGRIETTITFLLERRAPDGFWIDKWHISPYYATLACVHALARTSHPAASRSLGATLAWIAQTQRLDGGWGHTSSGVEETAYALLIVASARRAFAPLASVSMPAKTAWARIVMRGRRYLQRHMDDLAHPDRLPPLWVDKDLYAPPRIIRAAVLAALRVSAQASQNIPI
jgi:halimadienyl-diphosphate synthase